MTEKNVLKFQKGAMSMKEYTLKILKNIRTFNEQAKYKSKQLEIPH